MTDELTTLERRLAEREASTSIESYCLPAGDGWFDTAKHDEDCAEDVDEAVRYLEWRGLLERNEGEPHIVRIKDVDR